MNSVNNDLLDAAQNGNLVTIKGLLLQPDCDAKSISRSGMTALMYAAKHGHDNCVRHLLTLSDVKAENKMGVTALMYAAVNGDSSSLQLLLPLSDALAKDDDGHSALMYAAFCGHTSFVQLLLPVSDCLAKCMQGGTASVLAVDHGYPELGCLMDAYVLAMSELAVLQSFTAPAHVGQTRSLRV